MIYMPHWPVPLGLREVDLVFDRVKGLLSALGDPHLDLKIIHIAGTNGKGSTQAFIMQILKEAGYSVNSYISPHLVEFNERINLNGEYISDEYLYELCEECRLASERAGIKPTFFEGSTVLALLAFARKKADFVILETGMGGRFDATNIFDQPLVTVITTIGMDHMEFLGDTIEKIAFEKAGIIKPRVPCVISAQQDSVNKLLMIIADNVEAESFVFDYDWSIEESGEGVNYLSTEGDIYNLKPSLAGKHQYINMANAITAVRRCVSIDDEIIKRAVSKTKWQARIERLAIGRLQQDDGFDIWIDGAHNKLGSHVLSLWLEEQKADSVYLILGVTKGRDVKNFLSSFSPTMINIVFGVNVNYEPKSYTGVQVSDQAVEAGFVSLAFEYIEDAIEYIKTHLPAGLIIITGSLFLAGEAISKNKYSYKNKLHN